MKTVENLVKVELVVLFSGISLGILVGFLLGLSVAESVAAVISALIGLLATIMNFYFGSKYSDKDATDEQIARILSAIKLFSFQIIGFSLFCLIGAFSGLYMRTHNTLSPMQKEIPSFNIKKNIKEPLPSENTVLFSQSKCDDLLKINDSKLLLNELSKTSPEWQNFSETIQKEVPDEKKILILKAFIKANCN